VTGVKVDDEVSLTFASSTCLVGDNFFHMFF